MIITSVQQKIIFILKNHKKQLFFALFFFVALSVMKSYGITNYFNLRYLHDNISWIHTNIQKQYTTVVVLYLISYIGASALSIPGSTFFLTAAGFLFGLVPGFFLALIGATIGALMLFLISRYMIGSWVQHYFALQLGRFNKEITHHGFYYLLMIRLIGLLPFFVVNLLSGITLISPLTFLWTTTVGMMPFALVYSFIGAQLVHVSSLSYRTSPPIIIALLFFFIFKVVLVPLFYKKIKKRRAVQRKKFTS